MKKFNEWFNNLRRSAHRLNTLLVQKEAQENEVPEYLKKKIDNQIYRAMLPVTFDEFLIEIKDSEILASYICKPPSKQNDSERLQLKFLKEKEIDLKNLGNNAVRFNGVECSMDFQSKKFPKRYFIAKVCIGRGGAQNGVFREVYRSLEFLKENHLDYEFYALVDGDRFDDLSELKQFETDRVKVMSVNNYTE